MIVERPVEASHVLLNAYLSFSATLSLCLTTDMICLSTSDCYPAQGQRLASHPAPASPHSIRYLHLPVICDLHLTQSKLRSQVEGAKKTSHDLPIGQASTSPNGEAGITFRPRLPRIKPPFRHMHASNRRGYQSRLVVCIDPA